MTFTSYIGVRRRSGVPKDVRVGMSDPQNFAIADMRDRWSRLATVTSRRSQERADRLAELLLWENWPELAAMYEADRVEAARLHARNPVLVAYGVRP